MTITIDQETTVLVLRLVAKGKRAVDVATLAGVDLSTVRRIARENGFPDMGRIRQSIATIATVEDGPKASGPALVSATPPAAEHEDDPTNVRWPILDKAQQSTKHRTRQLAARIEGLLADLTQRIDAEAAEAKAAAERDLQKEHARAQIAELEVQLAAAKAVLKGKPRAAAPRAAAPNQARTTNPNQARTTKMIRAWAAEHGVPCSTRGRIARSVRDAYLAAHSAKAA